MKYDKEAMLSRLFQRLTEALDIPDGYHQEAEKRYLAVGKWLGDVGSPLTDFKPKIYPQGSFRLGTMPMN